MKKTKAVASKAAVQRTSQGLRDALFDNLDDLRAGRISSTTANATVKLASSIVNTVHIELSVAKFLSRTGKAAPKFASLTLGKN